MKHIVISIDNATVRIRADQVVATVEDGEGNVDIYIRGRETKPFKFGPEAKITPELIEAIWEDE